MTLAAQGRWSEGYVEAGGVRASKSATHTRARSASLVRFRLFRRGRVELTLALAHSACATQGDGAWFVPLC